MKTISATLLESVAIDCSAGDAHRFLHAYFNHAQTTPTLLVRIPLADLTLDREVFVGLTDMRSEATPAGTRSVMRLRWSAAGGGPYPTFVGTVTCEPDDATRSRLEIEGVYAIPGGIVGELFDMALGSRIAAAAARSIAADLARIVTEEHQRSNLLLGVRKPYPPTYE